MTRDERPDDLAPVHCRKTSENDFRMILLLVIGAPLWLAAGLVSALWYAVWALLSFLRLPTVIGGPLALVWMIVGAPFLLVFQWPSLAAGYLWHEYVAYERLVISDEGIFMETRAGRRLISWADISHVERRFQPPMWLHAMVLRDESRVELHHFTDTEQLAQAAKSRGLYRGLDI